MPAQPLITEFLANPAETGLLSTPAVAELLLRQARRANLLGRLGELGLEYELSPQAGPLQKHFESARLFSAANHRSVRREVQELLGILSQHDIPVCLLKGAAYVLGGVAAAKGRTFSDIDIMVPSSRLEDAQQVLVTSGWMYTKFDEYDQRYYREWMHELPPLRHLKRGTELDVHHTIVPPTAKIDLDVEKIWADVVEVEGMPGLYRPSDLDLLLHSAVHLFNDGEFENGLRDLSDIDLMIRAFSQTSDFWERIVDRAIELDLRMPLFYALRYSARLLKTPVPVNVLAQLENWSPNVLKRTVMDALFLRGLAPDHPTCNDALSGFARWVLYVRSHWLRMPPLLLVQHLTRKALRRWKSED